MQKRRLKAPSPAFVVSVIALFVALGGTTYAATSLPRNIVGTTQLKAGAVTKKKINKKTIVALKGNRGLQGPKGDTGAQGIQGVKGDTGARVPSDAYTEASPFASSPRWRNRGREPAPGHGDLHLDHRAQHGLCDEL